MIHKHRNFKKLMSLRMCQGEGYEAIVRKASKQKGWSKSGSQGVLWPNMRLNVLWVAIDMIA